MLQGFNKKQLSILLALVSFNLVTFSLQASWFDIPCIGLYVGGFGGGVYSEAADTAQKGAILFSEISGGTLDVEAQGHFRKTASGFGGVQLGCEWPYCPLCIGSDNWNLLPALELEAYFYHQTKKGLLTNTLSLDRSSEHTFSTSFPMNMGLYFVNGVLSLSSCFLECFSPYIGGGVGGANSSIRHATSLAIDSLGEGINYFNTKRHDSAWVFAAQGKAGIAYKFFERLRVFAEYRFLYVSATRYRFGSTLDTSSHVSTTPWKVDLKHLCNNAFSIGVQFRL